MKVTIEKNELVIRIPMGEPRPSASGKNMIVATTSGNQKTDCIHPKSKKVLTVGLSAYYKADDSPAP